MAQADQPGNADSASHRVSSGAPSVAYEAAGGYLISGLFLFGGLGLLLDRWLGTSVMTPIGIVVGGLLGGYLVYLRVVRAPHVDDHVQNGRTSGVGEGDGR